MRIISKNYTDYSYMKSIETMNILSFWWKSYCFLFVWFIDMFISYQASLKKKKSYNNFNELEKKNDIICTWDLLSY